MSLESSRSPNVVRRIEVYLDGASTPSLVLKSPPFRADLDTLALADGPHTLRLVQVYDDGKSVEQSVPFVAENRQPVVVTGIEPGGVVRGRLAIGLEVPDAAAPEGAAAGSHSVRSTPTMWLPALLSGAAFVGIWLFFVLMPIYGPYADRVAAGPPPEAFVAAAGGELFVQSIAADITGDGAVLGKLAVGTAAIIEADRGDEVDVVVEGWSMEAGPGSLFYTATQRITMASLTDDGLEAREVVESVSDTFGTVWQKVQLRGTVQRADLGPDLTEVWDAGAELNGTACGACHVLHAPDSFTVNQWPGTLSSYVPSQVSLPDDELEFLTKYLQYHARDM